jgi:predicted phage terminase large subunit-like protein
MAIPAIEWESLSAQEQLALAAAGETDPLTFCALWYNISQVDSFQSNWHHHYFNLASQKLLSGESTGMVINTPPGSTKTEFWSIHLPAYCMTQFDRVRILNTSYSKDLSSENSDRTRALVKSSEFQQFYPFEIGKDKVDDWTVESRGKRKHQLFSRPSGGQITGVRGGYMGRGFTGYVSADDWDKPDDMFSEAKRKKSQQRLINTLRSRRAHSKTPFLSVQQRLHTDDTTAFLLSGGMGITVDTHIVIPALINQDFIDTLPDGIRERCIRDVCGSEAVDGYWSYWQAKESVHDLIALRNANPYTFASQYMQNPESLDGGIFTPDSFRYYGDIEAGADLPVPDRFEWRLITADTAQKTNTWNDWTVFAEWGVYRGDIYRLAYVRRKMEAKELRQTFESFVRASHAKNGKEMGTVRYALVEDKSSGTGLIQEVKASVPVPVKAVQRNTDKLTRAMDVQHHHAAGRVILPSGDADNYEFISEVASFSADDSHKHDDQTDVMIDALYDVCVRSATGGYNLDNI